MCWVIISKTYIIHLNVCLHFWSIPHMIRLSPPTTITTLACIYPSIYLASYTVCVPQCISPPFPHLWIYLSIYPSSYLSIHLSASCQPTYLPQIHLSIQIPFPPSIHLYIEISIHRWVFTFIHTPIHLYIHRPITLSIHFSIYNPSTDLFQSFELHAVGFEKETGHIQESVGWRMSSCKSPDATLVYPHTV